MKTYQQFRSILAMIDWDLVGNLVAEGLKVFVAGIILFCIYSAEGIISTYKWLQPRLAQFLQSPIKVVKNGPMAVYTESVEAVLIKESTIAQRFIVSTGSKILMVLDTIGEIRENLDTLGIKIQNRTVGLSWGFTVYELMTVREGKVYVAGHLMK